MLFRSAGRYEIANMLQQYGMLSFENVPCRNSKIEDLDEQMLSKYLALQDLSGVQRQLFLSSLGIVTTDYEKERYYPTYGGLLLFGKSPQSFIPQAVLELICKDKVIVINGNLIQMIKRFKKTIQSYLPRNYPIEGVLEVVTNALIHRSYWNNAQFTKVEIGEAIIRISNPMSHENSENKVGGWRVNPWLYARLLLMHKQPDGFHLGIGLDETRSIFAKHGEIGRAHV